MIFNDSERSQFERKTKVRTFKPALNRIGKNPSSFRRWWRCLNGCQSRFWGRIRRLAAKPRSDLITPASVDIHKNLSNYFLCLRGHAKTQTVDYQSCIHSTEPNKREKKSHVSCSSYKLQKRRRRRRRVEPRGLTPTPSRDSSICDIHPVTSEERRPSADSSTSPPPQCLHIAGPDERWSWQSWGTKICVMLWLLMPHWQILLRRASSSRLKMITLVMWQIKDFPFQCQ